MTVEKTVHQRQLQELYTRLKEQAVNCAVVGPPKIGKTVFLENLRERIESQKKQEETVVYCDCKKEDFDGWYTVLRVLREELPRSGVSRDVLSPLRDAWTDLPESVPTSGPNNKQKLLAVPQAVAATLNVALQELSSLRVYLIHDRFDLLMEPKSVSLRIYYDGFLDLLELNPPSLRVVTSTPFQLPSGVGRFFRDICLVLPGEPEARALAGSILERSPEDRQVSDIIAEAGYHPYYIRALCNYLRDGIALDKWRKKELTEHFGPIWEDLDDEEKYRLGNLVEDKARTEDAGIELNDFNRPPLLRLERKAIIAFNEPRTRAWLPGKAIHWFVRQQTPGRLRLPPYKDTTMSRLITVTLFFFGLFLWLNMVFLHFKDWIPFLVWILPTIYGIFYGIYGIVHWILHHASR